jgi:proteic killer suppression protein
VEFAGRGTEDIFNGVGSKAARATLPPGLHEIARRKLDQLDFAASITDLAHPPGNKLELLKGNRKGQHSIRINAQYRICFRWADGRKEDVEIVDYD